ncbi:unnamed protein product [Caenorhabditis auriculariae]|uniref:Uncharacterized protein n=1 Tax=Caenorhabditis auriculariae TaxID=2777116 RepID=A0A8S1HNH7_9PELO|nr:unnamed protein product [Caenorhabditis auriculariae]
MELQISGNEKRSVAAENCGAEEFHCKSGECIAADKKCNRHYDCADGSDETTCDYYLAVQKYHEQNQNNESNDINSAQPVAQAAQAPELERHGVHHASHSQSSQHSTEASAQPEKQCTDQEFRCPYLEVVKCFHYDKLCDGHDDCGDGSDETNCDSTEDDVDGAFPAPSASSSVSSGQCTPQQFRCHSGRCIDLSLHCNRKYDCDDGTDETECEYFKAASQPRTDEREEELKRREQELERREQEERRREEEERRREHDERRREEEEKQRNGEGARRQQEEQRRNGDDARRQQEEQRREEEEKRRNGDDARRQHEERLRQSEEARRRHEDEVRRREEERRRHEQQQPQPQQRHPAQPAPQPQPQQHAQQHSQQHVQQQQQTQEQQRVSAEIVFRDEYDEESTGCLEHEFQCAIGECIDRRRVCDTRPDCLDSSDELNCSEKVAPAHPPTLPPVPTHNHIGTPFSEFFSLEWKSLAYGSEEEMATA